MEQNTVREITICDSSLAPDIRAGQKLRYDTDAELQKDDFVVVFMQRRLAVGRLLRHDSYEIVLALPRNSTDATSFNYRSDNVEAVAKVVEVV